MNETKIEFQDTSKECILMMQKLAKQALKDGGKVVTKILKQSVPVKTGGLKKSIVAWAKIDKRTGQPYLDIGYRSKAQMKKRGIKFWVNPCWFEFGVKPHVIMTKQFKDTGNSSYELKGGGKEFGVMVNHPGLPSKNFLRTIVQENIDAIVEAEKNALKDLESYTITQGMKIDLGGDEEID